MRTRHAFAASLLAALLLTSCGSDDASTDVATGPDETSTTTEADMGDDTDGTSTTSGTSPTGGAPTGVAQAAVDDLAERLGVDPGEITIASSEAVTWSDSSAGCPRMGFMYQQVLTEGTRTVLEVDGTRYHYHSAGTSEPFLCENPQEPQSIG